MSKSSTETGNLSSVIARLRHWMHDGLRPLAPEAAVLAVGCEQAFLAPQLVEYSADVTVLDTSGAQIGQLGRRFPEISFLQHDPARCLPFAPARFEAVWCGEFLDRIFDPAAALRELHRVLVPGGRLLVTVPDYGSVRPMWTTFFPGDESSAVNPRIGQFSRGSLAKLVRAAGFTEVHAMSAGAPRRAASGPRQLLLKARKSLVVQDVKAPARRRAIAPVTELARDQAGAARAA